MIFLLLYGYFYIYCVELVWILDFKYILLIVGFHADDLSHLCIESINIIIDSTCQSFGDPLTCLTYRSYYNVITSKSSNVNGMIVEIEESFNILLMCMCVCNR